MKTVFRDWQQAAESPALQAELAACRRRGDFVILVGSDDRRDLPADAFIIATPAERADAIARFCHRFALARPTL